MSQKKFNFNLEHAQKLFKGGLIKEDTYNRIQKYAGGGLVEDLTKFDPMDMTAVEAAPTADQLRFKEIADQRAALTPGVDPSLREQESVDQLVMEKQATANKAAAEAAQVAKKAAEIAQQNKTRSALGLPTLPGSDLNPGQNLLPTSEDGVVEMEQATPTQQSAQGGPTSAGGDPGRAFGLMESGIMKGMEAGAAEGAATATAMTEIANTVRDTAEKEQKLIADQNLRMAAQEEKIQLAMNEYASNKVDPNRFYAEKSTGQKIALAIGVMLSGVNGSTTGVQILNNAIERDIQAQKDMIGIAKEKVGMARTVYSDMMQRFGDERQALAASKVTAVNLAEIQLKTQLASLGGVRAQAEGLKALGELQVTKAKYLKEFRESTLLSGQFQGADALTKKILSIPDKTMQAEAFKELGEFNKIQSNLKQVDQAMDALSSISVLGRANPMSSTYETEKAKIVPIVKTIIGEAMQEADVKRLVDPLIPEFTDSAEKKRKKKEALRQMLTTQISGRTPRLSGLGILPRMSFTEKAAK